jgi:hypothetical protein
MTLTRETVGPEGNVVCISMCLSHVARGSLGLHVNMRVCACHEEIGGVSHVSLGLCAPRQDLPPCTCATHETLDGGRSLFDCVVRPSWYDCG